MDGLSWNQCARDFTHYLRSSGRAELTARTYCSNLSMFWRWCHERETDPRLVDRSTIRQWVSERLGAVGSLRVHNDVAALRHYYRYCREERWRDDDPTEGISVKRTRSLPTEPITWDEFEALLEGCTTERDRLIVMMLAYSGMRISEIAGMTAEDIDWQRGLIIVRGKGDKERRIAPNPDVLRRLRAFLGMFPTGPIWLAKVSHKPLSGHQIRKILYDVANKAHVDGVHPHRFRSFFATEYIGQFADIQALQGMMGHESIQTTARYSEYTRERRGLEQMQQFGATELRNQQAG